MKKVLFLLFANVFLITSIKAACSNSDIARAKSLVNNINISYDYYISGESAYFSVTINNVTRDMYFIDNATGKTYTYADTNDGEITIRGYRGDGGTYLFYSAVSSCYGRKLGSKYYNFPKYNEYYDDKICDGYENLNVCQKWTKNYYSYYEIEARIKKYEESLKPDDVIKEEYEKTLLDKIIDFYIKYYIYILGSVIIVFGGIVLIERKTNRFKI